MQLPSGPTQGIGAEEASRVALEPSSIVQEIADFLTMWACLEEGFKALDAAEQKAIREDNNLLPAVFQGFDGKVESDYLATASFMINHHECFSIFLGRDLEAYHPAVGGYRQLLKAFHPIWEGTYGTRTLTAAELRMVLSHDKPTHQTLSRLVPYELSTAQRQAPSPSLVKT